MQLYEAIILGLIEGITEFLPISSTGHLIVVSDLLNIANNQENITFEIVIQSAAILAVLSQYIDKLKFSYLDLWLKIGIAFIPIAIIGILFQHQIKLLFVPQLVGIMFIIGGIIFLIMEKYYQSMNHNTQKLEQISYKQSLLIGLSQVFALIPGTSRAGASIVGGLCFGLDRKTATEFSFLLALPVLGAAAGLELITNYEHISTDGWQNLLIGFITSYVVSFIFMKLLLNIISKYSFTPFGYYRIIFGIILLFLN